MFGFFRYGLPGTVIMVLALYHFFRRRPNTYWLFIIFVLGPLGALIYLATQALPELRDPGAFAFLSRGRRIRELEADVRQNPSAGNYEELGLLYLDERKWAKARACFDRSIAQRTDSPDPYYRRALAALELGDFNPARDDLERVVQSDAAYDIHRAAGLLAWACARTGQGERAEQLFRRTLQTSSLMETRFHFAEFLAEQKRPEEARQLLQAILAQRAGMPGFQRRRERPWLRQSKILLARLRVKR